MRISDWSSDVCSSDLLARLAVDLEIGQLHIHGRVVIPAFSRVELIVPFVLAGLGVESDDRREEKIVTLSSTSDLVIPRRAISGAVIDGVEFGVIGDGVPHGDAAAVLPPFALPALLRDSRRLVIVDAGLARHR